MDDVVTCDYFNFVDNGISGYKCSDGATCTNGFDSTGMTCDVDCGSSGLDVAGMACGSGGDGDGDDMGGDDNDDDMMDPAVTCNFADSGWTCDDGTECTTDPNGDTLD